jgi:hypothetical protein
MIRGLKARKGSSKKAHSRLSATHVVISRAAPDVATNWLSDPAYRYPGGQPRRLRMRGVGPCLSKLILRAFPKGDVDQIATFLVSSGSVSKSGGYYGLESHYVPFRSDLGAAFVHTATTLKRYLDTVTRNLSHENREDRFIERRAVNRHIPTRVTRQVHLYLKRHVGNLLVRVDAYLQRHAVAPDSEPTVELGLNVFAFEEQHSSLAIAMSEATSAPRVERINKPRGTRSRNRS